VGNGVSIGIANIYIVGMIGVLVIVNREAEVLSIGIVVVDIKVNPGPGGATKLAGIVSEGQTEISPGVPITHRQLDFGRGMPLAIGHPVMEIYVLGQISPTEVEVKDEGSINAVRKDEAILKV
jgi:hypothetical protein